MSQVATIHSAYDGEFDEVLKRLNLYKKGKQGELKCFFCDVSVDLENIYSVFPHNEKINICCDRLQCTTKLIKLSS